MIFTYIWNMKAFIHLYSYVHCAQHTRFGFVAQLYHCAYENWKMMHDLMYLKREYNVCASKVQFFSFGFFFLLLLVETSIAINCCWHCCCLFGAIFSYIFNMRYNQIFFEKKSCSFSVHLQASSFLYSFFAGFLHFLYWKAKNYITYLNKWKKFPLFSIFLNRNIPLASVVSL